MVDSKHNKQALYVYILCFQILNWLSTDGHQLLQKHRCVADNLKALRDQQADFECAYFKAMVRTCLHVS